MEQNDQRNFMIAIGLMVVMMLLYNTFVLEPQNRAQRARMAAVAAQTQAAHPVAAPPPTRDQLVIDDAKTAARVQLDGPAVNGSVWLKGSRIDDVSLKGFYKTVDDKEKQNKDGEIQLLSPEGANNAFYATVYWQSAGGSSTDNAVWTQTNSGALTADNPLKLSFTTALAKIDRTIAIDANYMFTVTDAVTNTGAEPLTLQPIAQVRQHTLPELLKADRSESQAMRGATATLDGKTNQTKAYASLAAPTQRQWWWFLFPPKPPLKADVNKGWIGLTTKYWMAVAIPPQGQPATLQASYDRDAGVFISSAEGKQVTIAAGQTATRVTQVFAGAKRVKLLSAYEKENNIPGLVDSVDWSWLFFITKPFFYLLQMFQGWFGSFGLAILALTVVVKVVFFPVQFNMYKTTARMRKMQPELDGLQKRFAADPQRLQQEKLKVMQREKVNPVAGCLPMLPQVFVFYALFHTLSVTLEMRHTPFYGWIRDMSAPDPTNLFNLFGLLPFNPASLPVVGSFLAIGAWPLIYGLTMFILQLTTTPPTDPTQKMVMRWMPLIYLFLFSQIASGLAIYYVWSNLISIGIQYYSLRTHGVDTDIDNFFRNLKKRMAKPANDDAGKTDKGDKAEKAETT